MVAFLFLRECYNSFVYVFLMRVFLPTLSQTTIS